MLPIIDLRETRTGARELKFLVPEPVAAGIVSCARAALEPDPNGGGREAGEYRTTTIYFDTADHHVRRRAGSFGRSKYRIRRYGSANVAYLERKLRTNTLLNKRRSVVGLDALPDLISSGAARSAPTWFTDRLAVRRLQPVCQITYRRRAFVGHGLWGPFRLTVDDGIAAQAHACTWFEEPAGTDVLAGGCVVEMKFCREAPSALKRIVEQFALSPTPLSKYRSAMDRLSDA